MENSQPVADTIFLRLERRAPLFLRLALATAFLSAVADRFGFWGQPGETGVAWGGFAEFTAYTAVLNPLLPGTLVDVIAVFVTVLEVVLALLLLSGKFLRPVALTSCALLTLFAFAMILTLGLKAPLDYSVFTAAAAALALAALSRSAA